MLGMHHAQTNMPWHQNLSSMLGMHQAFGYPQFTPIEIDNTNFFTTQYETKIKSIPNGATNSKETLQMQC
jgi:hypothetical protein